MLTGHLIPQDLAMGKNSPAWIPATTNPATLENTTAPHDLGDCNVPNGFTGLPALPWGMRCRQDPTVPTKASQSSLLPSVPQQKCCGANKALPVKSIATKHQRRDSRMAVLFQWIHLAVKSRHRHEATLPTVSPRHDFSVLPPILTAVVLKAWSFSC